MNNIFEQRIIEIFKDYKEWNLIQNILIWIIASIECQFDFWYWLDYGKSNKN